MTYEEIISRVADSVGLPEQLVDRTYKSYWRAIREYIQAVPLNPNLSDEEFLKLRPNVSIPSLGKLYVTLDRYRGVIKNYEIKLKNIENKRKKDNNNVEN